MIQPQFLLILYTSFAVDLPYADLFYRQIPEGDSLTAKRQNINTIRGRRHRGVLGGPGTPTFVWNPLQHRPQNPH